ncbi:hypothetical protein SAMN05444166_3677 [Singulisphaera sp. GP187]|uniref:hypothetical protein n=1 Tax=Singulisphaera sp. GP187 TaxID=1882752 RepID=UPI000928E17D|nr:hypothetical protein [Singulisphaera sp. GP187]SIO30974.1 hypothetical protein SAMN05444166_3677 [Singulisphaera sp. GP187]
MIRPHDGGLGAAFAWFLFPLAPAFLGRTYYETCHLSFGSTSAPDPRDWEWLTWVILVGPLLGYGFLAGATLDLPEDSGRRGFRGWMSHRAIWVGIGPWSGFLVAGALLFLLGAVDKLLPGVRQAIPSPPPQWGQTWWWGILMGAGVIGMVGFVGYGWLFVALAALRRARRLGRCRRVIERGLAGALAFVGSLFGSFWAITEVWRSYFFDSRLVPLLMVCLGLALLSLSGCASQLTYGEVRRRELFSAMLMAWLVGLAFAWRWWSRPRGKT